MLTDYRWTGIGKASLKWRSLPENISKSHCRTPKTCLSSLTYVNYPGLKRFSEIRRLDSLTAILRRFVFESFSIDEFFNAFVSFRGFCHFWNIPRCFDEKSYRRFRSGKFWILPLWFDEKSYLRFRSSKFWILPLWFDF